MLVSHPNRAVGAVNMGWLQLHRRAAIYYAVIREHRMGEPKSIWHAVSHMRFGTRRTSITGAPTSTLAAPGETPQR